MTPGELHDLEDLANRRDCSIMVMSDPHRVLVAHASLVPSMMREIIEVESQRIRENRQYW